MNLNSSLNPSLALLFSSFNHGNNSGFLSSSTQEQVAMLYQNLYKEAQKQVLFDLFFGGAAQGLFPKMELPIRQDSAVSTSAGSYNSGDSLKSGGIEEESENRLLIKHLKKPVFTITRQNKLSKSDSIEQSAPTLAHSDSKGSPVNNNNYNRKEKSLGELSKRFLTMFGRIDDCVISLDAVTKQLDVERRRVYDIINILESLGVVYRKGKNNYQWSGLQPIRRTIEKLGLRNDLKHESDDNLNDDSSGDDNFIDQRLANKKEKSLAYLAGSFIKLFFSWQETIPLEEAAWKLSPKNDDELKIKTKIRRLYDIANVFSSLGLIKKVCLDSKKPAFKWIGIPGLEEFIRKLNSSASKPTPPSDKPLKKKLPVTPTQVEEKLENPALLKIGSTDSAFKSHSDQSVKQTAMNDFMSVLMGLCTKEAQASFGHQNVKLESKGSEEIRLPIVPKVEKQTTSDRRRLDCLERMVLKENTSLNAKRPPPQSLGEFEIRTVKKINPIVQTSHEKTIVKSLKFNTKENMSFETKVEN